MFRLLKNTKGQAVVGEYVLVIFIVVTSITVMTIFFQRALQGRIRDARMTMERMVLNQTNASIWLEYEPYYANRTTETVSESFTSRKLLPTQPNVRSGIFKKSTNQIRRARSDSTVLPPRDAD